MRIALFPLLLLPVTLGAADRVAAVPDADRVVVEFHGVPVGFPLALVAAPDDPSLRSQAVARLQQAAKGEVQVVHKADYGADTGGTGRVFLRIGNVVLNELLVAEGLARFVPGNVPADSPQAKMLKMSEDRAKERGLGLWSRQAPPETMVAAATPPKPASPVRPAAAPAAEAPFAAELNGKYYHARSDAALASINPGRLIWYASEAEARKAGKQPAPQVVVPAGNSLTDADQAFSKGKELYVKAVNLPVSTERDHAYGESFALLTKAVQVYSDAAERRPADAALNGKLEEAMRLRYGAMKQKRPM